MARTLTALINRAEVPALEALQSALNALKFKLTVDESYVPFETSGYLPCTIDGEDGGCNIRFETAQGYLAEHPSLAADAARDALINLRWSGDPREEVCALMIAAVLAQHFDAVVHDPDKDAVIAADTLVSRARGKFAALD